ncbi:MAG TPA: hypothetical protein VFU47_02660 [Armatimonadota bacterium]|nr:hypothetical protein [Armatimonadota bacterium]
MPIDPEFDEVQEKPHELYLYANNTDVMITVQINGLNGSPEGVDAVALSLADYLQAWPGRSGGNVTGTKYRTLRHGITVTDPDEPEGEPNLTPEP